MAICRKVFDSRFNSPERHDNSTAFIYEWDGFGNMVEPEKEWLAVLILLCKEHDISIDAKISEYRGNRDSRPVGLVLVPGYITVAPPNADLYLSGPGQMVGSQVG